MGVKYDCHIMHPLKDQREGVKYGRGVKYGVTPDSHELRHSVISVCLFTEVKRQ